VVLEVQELIKTGEPSIKLNHRPLFSVVISCYNSGKTIGRLLNSLCNQKLTKDELEIIISDDCSTESYDDIVDEYKDRLNIKKVKTEYNCCPGNTRQTGLHAATGQWVCFSDHDDEFIATALDVLKERLNEMEEKYYIVTGFINQNEYRANNNFRQVKASDSNGWTHGKFYNLDNLVKEFNLCFKKDLLSHEDVYFTTSVNCIIEHLHNMHIDAGTYLDDLYTYVWYSHPMSLSHQYENNNINFLEKHFIEYCEATGEVYLDNYYKNIMTWTRTRQCLVDSLLLFYFYTQSFLFYNPNTYLVENFDYVADFLDKIKDMFKLTNTEIWMRASENNCFCYKQAEQASEVGTGGIIPSQTFAEWLDSLSPDGEEPTSIYYKR
jgi:glycosyltransferase involved in cell wall biosynthesis